MKRRQLGDLQSKQPSADPNYLHTLNQTRHDFTTPTCSSFCLNLLEDIEGYACLVHPVSQGLVDALFASSLHALLDEHLLEP